MSTTALAVVETMTGAELFQPGAIDPILNRIKAEVRAIPIDISTDAGRKSVASLAYKVAKSKTFIDGVRKQLVEGEKKRLKLIDQEGARIWDELEALQKEVRQPLTDWENAEKSRVAAHESALAELVEAGDYTLSNWQTLPLDAMRERLAEVTASSYDWQEFLGRAKAAVVTTVAQIKDAIARREKMDAEREELARLREEQAKREQQEREERIAREAKEAAEAAAKRVAEEAARAAEVERQRIEREKFEAEARVKAAEARAEAAAAQAERDKAAAIVAERRRVEAEAQRVAAEADARERNKAHAAKINREVRDAFVAHGLSEECAVAAVKAIAMNAIPHTKISY